MKKIINEPENFVKEMIEGIVAAHSDKIQLLNDDIRVLVRKDNPKRNKVGIVTAGGSGHLPTFLGYVGEGAEILCKRRSYSAWEGATPSPSEALLLPLPKRY